MRIFKDFWQFCSYIFFGDFPSSFEKRLGARAFWIRFGHTLQIAPPKESFSHLKKGVVVKAMLHISPKASSSVSNDRLVRKKTPKCVGWKKICPSVNNLEWKKKIKKAIILCPMFQCKFFIIDIFKRPFACRQDKHDVLSGSAWKLSTLWLNQAKNCLNMEYIHAQVGDIFVTL